MQLPTFYSLLLILGARAINGDGSYYHDSFPYIPLYTTDTLLLEYITRASHWIR